MANNTANFLGVASPLKGEKQRFSSERADTSLRVLIISHLGQVATFFQFKNNIFRLRCTEVTAGSQ
jgi:hypothetical protein